MSNLKVPVVDSDSEQAQSPHMDSTPKYLLDCSEKLEADFAVSAAPKHMMMFTLGKMIRKKQLN